jgi:hypothetical protein
MSDVPAAETQLSDTLPREPLCFVPSWEDGEKSLFVRWMETTSNVLNKPFAFFTAMKKEGNWVAPLVYAAVGLGIASTIHIVYALVFALRESVDSPDLTSNAIMFGTLRSVGKIFLTTFFVLVFIFLHSGIAHLCLKLITGTGLKYETTLRVYCYAYGTIALLIVVPFCGILIVACWSLFLCIVGLAKAHKISSWQTLIAVFLPSFFTCIAGHLVVFVLGGVQL